MRTNPEALLISAILRTGEYQSAVRHGASHRLFHVHHEEWAWIEQQWDRGRVCPSKSTFKARYPNFSIYKSDDIVTCVDMVKKAHARYETQRFVEEAVGLIENGKADDAVRLISKRSSNLLYEIEHNADAVDIVDNWEDTFNEVSARIARVAERGSSGVPTSMRSLDLLTGGMQGGWLTVIAARLGVGKTWALIRAAYGAVLNGHDVLFFSLEQSRHQVSMRMQGLAAHDLGYEINPAKLMQGVGIDPVIYKNALVDIKETLTGKFYVNDAARGRVSVKTVEAAIEAKKPAICFIDYITLLSCGSRDWQEIAQLGTELKLLSEQYDIPILTASQLNRSGTGKDPGTEHISQSDTIGHDADLILTLVKQTEHVRRMKVVKNRHGADGVAWPIHFDPSKGIFEEITGNKAQDLMDGDLDED